MEILLWITVGILSPIIYAIAAGFTYSMAYPLLEKAFGKYDAGMWAFLTAAVWPIALPIWPVYLALDCAIKFGGKLPRLGSGLMRKSEQKSLNAKDAKKQEEF